MCNVDRGRRQDDNLFSGSTPPSLRWVGQAKKGLTNHGSNKFYKKVLILPITRNVSPTTCRWQFCMLSWSSPANWVIVLQANSEMAGDDRGPLEVLFKTNNPATKMSKEYSLFLGNIH